MGGLVRASARAAWIPSIVLVLLEFGIALAAATWLFQRIQGAGANLDAPWTDLLGGVGVGVAFIAFAFVLPALVALVRRVLPMGTADSSIPLTAPGMMPWYHNLLSSFIVHTLCGWFLRCVGLYALWCRMMGMRVGAGTVINSTNVYDHELVELGRGVLIGGDAWLLGHVAERGLLVRKRIIIEDDASIGLQAVIMPGARIGRNCQVGAMSLVPKDAVLEADSIYAGVPVRRIA
jgi:serine acetyltransferase